jgi:hypothetical protein
MKLLVLLPVVILASCGQPEPLIITPPPALLTCADEPAPPQLPPRDGTPATELVRDKAMLEGYLALRSAWGDCHAKVEGVKAWTEEATKGD